MRNWFKAAPVTEARRNAPPGVPLSSLRVTAEAPALPPKTDATVTEILPPFGTNPPTRPVGQSVSDPTQRFIGNDPRELWYLALPSKLLPKQVLQILRAALGGDIWQQWQLLSLMMDSWPMLRKCAHELRQAVSQVAFTVKPFTAADGEEPDDDSKERADLVTRAMKSFLPNPMTDEKGWSGMIYDLTDAILNGLTMTEIMWYQNADYEWLPRAAAWVHPRHFTFTNDGKIAVFDENYNRLNFTLTRVGQDPEPNKFVVAQFMSRSGSSLGAGLMRPLAWAWSAVMYNREWMLGFAQKYGNPFLVGTYKPGTPDAEITKLNQFLANAGAQGWANVVEGTTIQVEPAQSLGAENPQARLMEIADEWCQLLMLGQTGTTKPTPGKLGNQDTQDKVKREIIEGIANWVASMLTEQFVTAVLRMNYGAQWQQNLPTVTADFTEPTDPLTLAQRDQIFLTASVPMDAEEFYKRHNMKQPETGDLVITGGQLGELADTTQEVGGPPPAPPGFGDEDNFQDTDDDFDAGGGDSVGASNASRHTRKTRPERSMRSHRPSWSMPTSDEQLATVLTRATDQELRDLHQLTVTATEQAKAGKMNGEWQQVAVKIKTIKQRFDHE